MPVGGDDPGITGVDRLPSGKIRARPMVERVEYSPVTAHRGAETTLVRIYDSAG